MKIGLARYKGNTTTVTSEDILRGEAHIARLFDNKIMGIREALDCDVDYMLFLSNKKGLAWLAENGKPKNWGKVISTPTGPGENYDPGVIEQKLKIDFDGYIVPETTHFDYHNIFGKPLIRYTTPHSFDTTKHLRAVPKKRKVFLHIPYIGNQQIHGLNTLAVFKMLNNAEGVARRKSEDLDIRRIVKSLDLNVAIHMGKVDRDIFLESIADCKVILSMDQREMIGHSQLDGAYIGAYSVAPDGPMQRLVFPNSIVSPYDIKRAAYIVNKLLDGPDYVLPKKVEKYFEVGSVGNRLKKRIRDTFE